MAQGKLKSYHSSGAAKGRPSTSKHPGFKAIQKRIAAQQGIPEERAGAILANAGRNASPAAKKANPRLKRIRGA